MKNLIRMDFYRLFHSKALKVGIIAAFLVAIATALFNYGIVELVKMTMDTDPEAAAGIGLIIPAVGWIAGVDFADIVITGTGAFSLLISCIAAASFISAEQSCGYVKNVIGQLPDRGYTIISKFVVTSAIQLIVLLVYTLVNLVTTKIFFGPYIVSYSIGGLVGALMTRLLLYLSINAVILFLCTLTRSQSLAMVIGAIFGIGVTKIVYLIISGMLSMLKIDLTVANYTPDGINSTINLGSISSLYGKAIGISLVYIAVFLVWSIAIVKKRDVR